MNFKKIQNKFWARKASGEEGFTLVELIVVIAILGILAGVGTVAYSGYVKKANMQADMTLASEVENALLLAFYNQKLSEPTTVVVYYDETKDADASTDAGKAAMEAAFGSGWESLRLSYSGWAEEIGVIADSDMINYVNNSTFRADEETLGGLLEDVEHVVGVLAGAIEGGSVNINAGSSLDKFLTNAGVAVDDSNAQAISNATVMYVAGNMDAATTTAAQKDAFAKTWATLCSGVPDFSGSLTDDFAAISAKYAFVEALAKYVDSYPGSNTSYVVQLREASANATGSQAMGTALTSVYNSIAGSETNAAALFAYYGITDMNNFNQGDLTLTPAYTDAMAFLGYMQGISSSSDSLLSGTDLTNKNYYTDGQVLNYVTNYVSIGQAMLDMGVDSTEGVFVIHFDGEAVACMPLDY